MSKNISIVLLGVMIVGIVFWGSRQFQTVKSVVKPPDPVVVKAVLKPESEAVLERSEKMRRKFKEFRRMMDAFHKEEEVLRQQLKETKDNEAANKIREQLLGMRVQHDQALQEERAKLGLPKLRRRQEEHKKVDIPQVRWNENDFKKKIDEFHKQAGILNQALKEAKDAETAQRIKGELADMFVLYEKLIKKRIAVEESPTK